MSSIAIVQEHNRFTYIVDTAVSCIYNGIIYRVRESRAQKTYQIGSDVVFMAGGEVLTNQVLTIINNLLDVAGHINVDALQQYLVSEYSNLHPDKDHVTAGITITIMSLMNGKTIIKSMNSGYNDYQISEVLTPPEGIITLSTDGFNNMGLRDAIVENERVRFERTGEYYILEDILQAYRDHYSEGVGGELLMYRFDDQGVTLIHSERLHESGLKYLDKGLNYVGGEPINVHINGYTPINAGNIGSQSVASAEYAGSAGNASYANEAGEAEKSYYSVLAHGLRGGYGPVGDVYISASGNFRPFGDGTAACGSSEGRFSSVWAVNGVIQTSDADKKNSIQMMGDKYLLLAKQLVPRSFKMNEGTSGRTHVGFIAQEIEEAMSACGISDMEFAGLIRAPRYAKKLQDEEGNNLNEYDTSSEIIGYDYALRYDEFIPLLLARVMDQEERLTAIEKMLGIN